MRLGQRLSGGVGAVLERTDAAHDRRTVELVLPKNQEALIAEPVWRRLERLSASFDRRAGRGGRAVNQFTRERSSLIDGLRGVDTSLPAAFAVLIAAPSTSDSVSSR